MVAQFGAVNLRDFVTLPDISLWHFASPTETLPAADLMRCH